jgi:peptidoglycan/LPS O-acetylase OafA/YrhL
VREESSGLRQSYEPDRRTLVSLAKLYYAPTSSRVSQPRVKFATTLNPSRQRFLGSVLIAPLGCSASQFGVEVTGENFSSSIYSVLPIQSVSASRPRISPPAYNACQENESLVTHNIHVETNELTGPSPLPMPVIEKSAAIPAVTERHRYAFLDGIRGMAAILILIRHTGTFWHFAFYRSYLAVDLFFVLSGFVIAYAYDEKLRTGAFSVGHFVKVRLIRLYPVYLMSLLLCAYVSLSALSNGNAPAGVSRGDLLTVIALSALYLPSRLPGMSDLFPINSIYWSLFFELVVNVAYARARSALSARVLVAIAVFFGLVLAALCLEYGKLDEGFTWTLTSFIAGLSRASFGIFLGLLLFRIRSAFLQRWGSLCSPWVASFIICLMLVTPKLGRVDGLIDWLAVVVIFPAMVLFASKPSATRLAGLLEVLGSASYPIYVFHRPIGELITHNIGPFVSRHAPFSGLVLLVLLVAFSVLLERYIDIPVRRWLSAHLAPTSRRG